MSDANITRQFLIVRYDPKTRRIHDRVLWTYGQAMHAATAVAEDHPDKIVSIWSRVVIVGDLEEPDFEGEEHRMALRAAEREEAE